MSTVITLVTKDSLFLQKPEHLERGSCGMADKAEVVPHGYVSAMNNHHCFTSFESHFFTFSKVWATNIFFLKHLTIFHSLVIFSVPITLYPRFVLLVMTFRLIQRTVQATSLSCFTWGFW